MPLDQYTDDQLRAALRAGPIPADFVRGATVADKIRLLRLVAGDSVFAPEERRRAAERAAELERLARLRGRGRHGARQGE